MDEEETREGEEPRRVVRRVVRRAPVAPPPPHASARPAPPAPVDEDESRQPDPARAPSPDRPTHRARPGRPSLPRLSWPTFARSTGTDEVDGGPPEVPAAAPSTRAAAPVEERVTDHDEQLAEPAPGPTVTDTVAVAAADTADPAEAGPSARERVGAATARTRERLLTATAGTRRAVAGRAATAPLPAVAAVTGLVLGVAATVLCWLATLVFAATLGTPAGGGWGFVVLVLVAVVAVVAGARALAAAGAPEPGPTSLVGVLLVPVVVLALFLGPSTTGWVFVLVPLLGAAAFAVAQPVVARLAGPGGRP